MERTNEKLIEQMELLSELSKDMFTAIIKQRVEIFVDTGIDSVVCFLKTVIE